MSAELIMYQSKVSEYKHDLNQLTGDMNLLKLAYFTQRKKQQRMGKYSGGTGTSGAEGREGGESITVGGQTIYLPPRDQHITDYTPYSEAAQRAVASLPPQQHSDADVESHPVHHHQQAYDALQQNMAAMRTQHVDVEDEDDMHVDEALSRSESAASVS